MIVANLVGLPNTIEVKHHNAVVADDVNEVKDSLLILCPSENQHSGVTKFAYAFDNFLLQVLCAAIVDLVNAEIREDNDKLEVVMSRDFLLKH